MTITYHDNLTQGTDEWHDARRGIITASEVKLILTEKTLKFANNDKSRAHVWEIAAQRISGYTEPSYIGDNMLRGWADEIKARELYAQKYAPVTEVGFVTNDKWGFTIGYSPDGLVGDDGLIEAKSRIQKYQIETIAEGVPPGEFALQLQTGLLVTERKWIDFLSYSGGLPMAVMRVYPDPVVQSAIVEAAAYFEGRVDVEIARYRAAVKSAGYHDTVREVEQEVYLG